MNDSALTLTSTLADAAPAACWSCRGPVAPEAIFCATCKAVQPPRALDHFTRLALPVDFLVDTADLDRRYFAAQRQLHPDRFATKSPRERLVSQNQAVTLNEAYETIKDPLSRANYLLKLKGIDVNPDGCHTINDPTLLMEQLERREALAEADTPAKAEAIARETASHVDDSLRAIAAAF